jgi:putative Holliday junction resolvase
VTRILGLDHGTARVGVALSDESRFLASPKGFIPATPKKQCLEAVAELCRSENVGMIVLGLPKHMNGDEGDSAKAARKFGALAADKTGLPVEFVDERLSTVAADRALSESNVRGRDKRKRVDAAAAAIILQTYLDSQQ